MHPTNSLEICDYLDGFVHIFKYVTQEKLWDVLPLAMKQMTLIYRKFSDRKIIQNRPNFKLTLVIKMIRYYGRKTHNGLIAF